MDKKSDVAAQFAINFILMNAQQTSKPGVHAVYGTLYEEELQEIIDSVPNGRALYEKSVRDRELGKKQNG